ncbi:hypothetical protein, partial [Haemophilus influenzae]|uniref:hypothetical protein n=1 Tax=Haemophilus influenzae TaxID=727 RepID=UPI003C6C0A2D
IVALLESKLKIAFFPQASFAKLFESVICIFIPPCINKINLETIPALYLISHHSIINNKHFTNI